MAFWNLNSLELEAFRPGINSRAELGEQLIMAYMEIAAGEEDSGHLHPYDQCGVVMAGHIEMFIGSERKLLSPTKPTSYPRANRTAGRPSMNRPRCWISHPDSLARDRLFVTIHPASSSASCSSCSSACCALA